MRGASSYKKFLEFCWNAPKVKRTHIYCSPPHTFEMRCPKNKRHKLEWSEFEKHVWCYNCEKDFCVPEHSRWTGIFSGPILVNVAQLMGCDFRRLNLETKEIIEMNDHQFNKTWVLDSELIKYLDPDKVRRKYEEKVAELLQ